MEFIRAILVNAVVPLVGVRLFLRLRERMRDADVPKPPDVPLFILFATYGGWLMVVLTTLFWRWSGMATIGLAYLIFVAPIVTVVLAVILYRQRRLSGYHSAAFWASAGCICLPIAMAGLRMIYSRIWG
jgi:hypothetical protein